MMIKEKVLITGGNGFLGKYLAKALAAQGAEVTINSRKAREILNGKEKLNRTENYSLLTKDIMEITAEELLPYSIIFHLAALTPQKSSSEEEIYTKNVEMTQHLLEMLARNRQKVKLVFVSSAGVYGFAAKKVFREEDALNPQNAYAKAKVEGEKLIQEYAQKFTFLSDYLILRLANIYGLGQQRGWFVPDTIEKIRNAIPNSETGKNEITIFNGDSIRDFIYVEDAVEAILVLIKSGKRGIFNVGGGKQHSLREITSELIDLSSEIITVHYVNKAVNENALDITKIIQATKWKPKVALKIGLKRVWGK